MGSSPIATASTTQLARGKSSHFLPDHRVRFTTARLVPLPPPQPPRACHCHCHLPPTRRKLPDDSAGSCQATVPCGARCHSSWERTESVAVARGVPCSAVVGYARPMQYSGVVRVLLVTATPQVSCLLCRHTCHVVHYGWVYACCIPVKKLGSKYSCNALAYGENGSFGVRGISFGRITKVA